MTERQRHLGEEAFARFQAEMPLTYSILKRPPDTWYPYNSALAWKLPGGGVISVMDGRLSLGTPKHQVMAAVDRPFDPGVEYDEFCALLVNAVKGAQFREVDTRPHSRACGWRLHDHGPACHRNCPTCGGLRG